MTTIATKRRYFFLTILLLIFHLLCNWYYLQGDLNIQQKDVAAHLKVHTKFYLQARDLFRNACSPWDFIKDFTGLFHQESMEEEHIWIWPRLVYTATFPLTALFGLTPRVIIFSNGIWLAVLIFSVYFIGLKNMNPQAGFLSALVVSFFPATYGLSRKYGLDFPLMAMVALNLYWLIQTDFFSNRTPSFLFGCTMGLGLLVKVQIIIFMAGPLIFALGGGVLRFFRGHQESGAPKGIQGFRPGRSLINVLIAALCMGLISSLFWRGNLDNIYNVFFKHATEIEEFAGYVDIDAGYLRSFVLSPQYFAFYVVTTILYVSPLFFALSIIMLPAFLSSSFRAKMFVILSIIIPYIIWTAIEIKYAVFYLVGLPAFSIVIGVGLASLRKKLLKYGLTGVAVAWGLFHFLNLSFSVGPAPYKNCALFSGNFLRDDGYPVWAHPAIENNLETVVRNFIAEIDRLEEGNNYVRIGILEFEYSDRDYLLVDGLEYFMESVDPHVYVYRSFFSPDSFLECMDSFNFIIVLEEGEKAAPDFNGFERYFTEGRGAYLCKKYLKSEENFLRLTKSYQNYEILDSDLLLPLNISAFLLRKPSFPVGDTAVIPATHLYSANVYIAYPYIGIAKELLHNPTIGDYDVLFPYDLDFPLVPPDRRDPAEPYYSLYQLSFESGGEYGISVGLEGKCAVSLDALINGREVNKEAVYTGQDATGDTIYLGSFRVDKGVNNIKLIGENGFPVIKDLRIRKQSGQRAGGQGHLHCYPWQSL